MTPRPANTRIAAEVLEAAADMVEATGPDRFTMRALAERVGYCSGTIYLYYKDKEHVLDKLVNEAFEWLFLALESCDHGQPVGERIHDAGHTYMKWGIEHPELYKLMFEMTMTRPTDPDEMQRRRRAWRFTRAVVAEAVATGYWSAEAVGDLDKATNLVWIELHGVTSLSISHRLWGEIVEREELLSRGGEYVDRILSQWDQALRPKAQV